MNGLRVLLVDDETEFANTLAERLNLRGFQAETAANSRRAIQLIQQKEFDVVVLDLVLPGCRGLDVLMQIKRICPGLPVILLSGRGSDKDFEEGRQKGACDFLIKPVQIETLIEKMQQAVQQGQRRAGHDPESQP